MDSKSEEYYRRTAVKIVDAIHDFGPHLIVHTGRSSRPAWSLITEAWRRRYPKKPLPHVKHFDNVKPEDVREKKIALVEEVVVSGSTLKRTADKLSAHAPAQIAFFAFVDAGQSYVSGFDSKMLRTGDWPPKGNDQPVRADLGINLRNQLVRSIPGRKNNKWAEEILKKDRERISEKRAELRRIASSIKPRKQ